MGSAGSLVGVQEIRQFKDLTLITLSNCPRITCDGLKELGELKNLKYLYLSGCDQISEVHLRELTESLPNLMTIR